MVKAGNFSNATHWTLLRWIASAVVLLSIAPAGAHRGHAVWTDITWSGESFEIVHRMHLADAIVVNRYMGGTLPIEELRSLALVALYVDERFKLLSSQPSLSFPSSPSSTSAESAQETKNKRENLTPIELLTIGAEIEDDFLLVYQEWVTPLPERFPVIDNFVLLDVEPEAQAFIKIKGPGLDEERER